MNTWSNCGVYISRDVLITTINTIDDSFDFGALHESVVLVYTASSCVEKDLYNFSNRLIEKNPLLIAYAGPLASFCFDCSLRLLAQLNPVEHIMTMHLESDSIEEVVADFLGSAWPSEERFGAWKSYSIFSLDEKMTVRIQAAVAALQ